MLRGYAVRHWMAALAAITIATFGTTAAGVKPAQALPNPKLPSITMSVGKDRFPPTMELLEVKAGGRLVVCGDPRPRSLKVHWTIDQLAPSGSQFAYVPGEPNCRRYVASQVLGWERVIALVSDGQGGAEAYVMINVAR